MNLTEKYFQLFDEIFTVVPQKEKKRIVVFSNVKYPAEHRITTRKTDILVFLNTAVSAKYYQNDEVEKFICWHRTQHRDFGQPVSFAENHYCGHEIPQELMKKWESTYDWHYSPRPSRNQCMTTGYIVVKYLEEQYPDRELVLVNFGMEIPGSTRRSSDHNWQYEDKQLQRFQHIYTQDARTFRKRRIYVIPSAWLGDNVLASAVIKNIVATGLFDVNVDPRSRKIIWENCPYLDHTITKNNCDNVFRMRDRDRWTVKCRHIIEGTTAEFSGFIGEKVPCSCRKPEIYAKIPAERLVKP